MEVLDHLCYHPLLLLDLPFDLRIGAVLSTKSIVRDIERNLDFDNRPDYSLRRMKELPVLREPTGHGT